MTLCLPFICCREDYKARKRISLLCSGYIRCPTVSAECQRSIHLVMQSPMEAPSLFLCCAKRFVNARPLNHEHYISNEHITDNDVVRLVCEI